jgi:hypothetical protein
LAFVLLYGVDVLFMDDWADARTLLITDSYGPSFGSLWKPHNEHRIFLSRALFLLNAHLGLNQVRLMVLSTLVLFAVFVLLVPQLLDASSGWRAPARTVFLFLASAFFFSLAQWENYLGAFQTAFALSALGMVLGLFGIATRRVLVVAAGFALSYLSSAYWLALALVLVAAEMNAIRALWWTSDLRRRLVRAGVVVAAVGALAYAYLSKRAPVSDLPSRAEFLLHPALAGGFFLAHLGAPFAHLFDGQWGETPLSLPIIAGCLFCAGAAFVLHERRAGPLGFCHWLIVGTFGIAALVTAGRSALGIHQGTASRYVTLVNPGWIGLCCALIGEGDQPWRRRLVLGVLGLGAVGSVQGLVYSVGSVVPAREAGRACLARLLEAGPEGDAVAPRCLQIINPSPSKVVRLAFPLQRRGFLP